MIKSKITIASALTYMALSFAALIMLNYSTISYINDQNIIESAQARLANRNAKLSQEIAYYAQKYAEGNTDVRPVLNSLIELKDNSMSALSMGGHAPDFEENIYLPQPGDQHAIAVNAASGSWRKYKDQLRKLMNDNSSSGNGMDQNIPILINQLQTSTPDLVSHHKRLGNAFSLSLIDNKSNRNYGLWLLLALNIGIVAGGLVLAKKYISKPISNLADQSGNISESTESYTDPHLRKIATQLADLNKQIKEATVFSENIGDGNFDFEVDATVDSELFNGLNTMKSKLAALASEDRKRTWISEGVAYFSDILRNNQTDITALSNKVIQELVKYLKANQGSLFILNETDYEEETMELTACYAYNRKKYLEKTILKGEGLTGQAWLEGEYIYLTEVPENYVTITSGIGESTPKAVLIVPLKVNDKILGLVELASFNVFDTHEIEFLKKVGEDIASTLSFARNNTKTKELLEESRQQTEELRTQEEEMRQNMEEMLATQEEMNRTQIEISGTMAAINSTNGMIEFDPDGNILSANDLFLKSMQYSLAEIEGKHHRIFMSPEDANTTEYEFFWQNLKAGKPQTGEFKRKAKDGTDVYIQASYTPVIDNNNQVIKIIKLATDTTENKIINANYENQISAINSSQAVIEFNMSGHILKANEIFLDTMKYGINEIEGRHHSIFCTNEYAQSDEYQEFWAKLRSGKFSQGEYERINKKGETVRLKATYTPINDLNGKPYKVVKFASVIEQSKLNNGVAHNIKINSNG